MSENSSTFRIPFAEEQFERPVFVEKTPVFDLFEELNAISEEVEKCRKKAIQ